MRVVVVALGKIGLPLAVRIALAGHEVIGCDIQPGVVEAVNAGRAPFPGEAGLEDALRELVGDGRLVATLDTSRAVARAPELVVAVPPLAVDGSARPDYSSLDAAVSAIGAGLREAGPAQTVVSVETTMPVGCTRTRLAPLLERASGLRAERDFFLVHSPERVYSGRILRDLDTYPKLVGGLSAEGEERAAVLYRSFLGAEVRTMGSAEAAELTKLAETTYRDVNIALANELARFADRVGIDVAAVIEAANTQPFSHIHQPGIAVGGHCIPVYPRFLLAGDPEARLPRASREVNEGMPQYALERLAEGLGGSLASLRVLILGVSYRGAVKESAFSGAHALREGLERRGALPIAADPLYDGRELRALGFEPWDGAAVDAAIVQADHPQYRSLGPGALPGARVVLDGRGVLDPAPFAAAGVGVLRIGRPSVAPAQ